MAEEKTSILLSDVSVDGDLVEKDKITIDAKVNGDIKAEEIEKWLKQFDHRKIEIVDGYMPGDEEFTVYFYKA